MKVLAIICSVISVTFATHLVSTDDIEELFLKAFRSNLTEEETKTFGDLIDILRRPEYLTTESINELSSLRTTFDCIICRSAVSAYFQLVRSGVDDSELIDTVDFLCVVLGIQSGAVCRGAIKLNIPIISHIVRTTPEVSAAMFCALIEQSSGDANNSNCPAEDDRFEWQVELPPPPTEPIIRNDTDDRPLNIIVFTDAHLDPLYEAFGAAECGEPTCCRKGQSVAQHYVFRTNDDESILKQCLVEVDNKLMLDVDQAPSIRKMRSSTRTMYPAVERNPEPAGYWGDYRDCDTSLWAYDDIIERMAETHNNIDAIYYIGDTIDHGIWETTYELINDMNAYLVDKIKKHFGDVLVVPSIGNHESQPTNQFAPASVTGAGLNTTWLYDALVKKWGSYLTEEARARLAKHGDFSVLVRPGLRAISLNNNVAYKMNWWVLYDPMDAKNHLEWLVEELYKAELAGEKVHILAHLPPGVADLTHTWTREYNKIVNRFSSTIAAEFNGHTHSDEFKIFYNEQGEPINMAWGGGSATTYSFYNHNYKVFSLDPATFQPFNIVNYAYNMTEANLTPHRRPHWFQLYDMRNTFQLKDLSAASMNDLVYGMASDRRHFLDLYVAFFSRINDQRWAQCRNNTGCKLNILCRIVVTVLWERQRCEELTILFNMYNKISN